MKYLKTIMILMMVLLYGVAKAHSSDTLNLKDQALIKIAANTAIGNLPELQKSLEEGLKSGMTVNEIKEALVHCYAYAGFPRAIRGLQTFMELLEKRQKNGIADTIGKDASPITNDSSKYERGKKILGELTGTPQPMKLSGYAAFAPAMDTFLKEHLFADIFERDILNYAQRELVTISVIAAIGDAEPMLQSHLVISLKVGWSAPQLKQFIQVIAPSIGSQKAKQATTVLAGVLKK